MLQPRWETSKRPLFIKTIWTNGYHHPVLFDDDSIIKDYHKTNYKERRTKSAIVLKNKWNDSPRNDEDDRNENKCLKITTIRLLLAGIRGFKEASHTHTSTSPITNDEDSITIDVLPKDTVKFKDLNDEISFQHQPKPITKRTKFYNAKSSSFDVTTYQNTATNKSKLNCDCNDLINNTLSERVMVWLDLAASQGDDKKRTVNNASNNQKTVKKRGAQITRIPINKPKEGKRITFDESQNKFFLNNADHSILKGIKLYSNQVNGGNNNNSNNSRKREEKLRLNCEDSQRDKIKLDVKRRLHIFMPDVPNKNDCDSSLSLSCKSSSLIRRS